MHSSRRRRLGLVAGSFALAGLALVALGSMPARAADPSLVAEWTFDEGSGTTAADATGNGHTGTLSGTTTWATLGAKQGSGALQLVGDGKVTVPLNAALKPASVTITAWFRSSTPASSLVARWAAPTCSEDSLRMWAGGDVGVEGHVYSYQKAGPYGSGLNSNLGPVFDGNWHLLTYTYDTATGDAAEYIDGVSLAVNYGPLDYSAVGSSLIIGGSDACGSGSADEVLDDVRVYSRALSTAEVNAFLPHVATTTTVAWPSGPIAADTGKWMDVTVSPAPPAGGTLTLWDVTSGTPVYVFMNLMPDSTAGGIAVPNGLSEGDHTLYVTFSGGGIALDSQSASSVVTIQRTPDAISLQADHTTRYVDQPLSLTATLAAPTDAVTLYDAVDGAAPTKVDQKPPLYSNVITAAFSVPSLAPGVHHFTAVTAASDLYLPTTSPEQVVTVTKRPTWVSLSFAGVAQEHHPIIVVAVALTSDQAGLVPDGAGTLTIADGGTELGTLPITSGQAEVDLTTLTPGQHTFTAAYSGTDLYAGSTTEKTLVIAPDTVDASGIGVAYSVFYPYRDGYRDAVAVRGVRNEPISVSIKVYSPLNKLLKSASVALGTDAYSYAWNGRNSAGTILPAGKYKVIQVLTDSQQNKVTATSYVTLSPKRLYTKSVTLTQRNPQDIDAGGASQGWIGWDFIVPSATVYKSIRFSVYGKVSGTAYFSLLEMDGSFPECGAGTWSRSCPQGITKLTSSYGWRTGAGYPSSNIVKRHVHMIVWVGSGTAWVKYGRITVTYAVLK